MGQGESGFSGCRLGLPQLSPTGAGFLPRLPTLPLACFLAPYPPSPLPPFPRRGRGILSFLMQGAPPLASPGAEPGGTYSPFQTGHPAGAGFLPRLPTLPLACFLAPYPPSPPSPGGEGGILGFLMQEAPPLASPGAEPGGTYSPCHAGHPAGGGLASPPANPAFSLLSCPLSPSPSRRGAFGFLPTTEDTDARQPSATPTQINATPPSTNNIY